MTVASVLTKKGRRVVNTRPESTIQTITRQMTMEGVGAVVVMGPARDDPAKDEVLGIISERDITYGLAEHGEKLMRMQAAEIMSSAVVLCGFESSVTDVMTVMTRGRLRHLPVMDKDELCGVISIGDVVKHRLEQMELEVNVMRDVCTIARSSLAMGSI